MVFLRTKIGLVGSINGASNFLCGAHLRICTCCDLVNPRILALPRHGFHYTLETDACEYQVGCTLLQDQPNGDRLPIGYWSRSLTKAEKNYSTSERECLAIVWGVLTLRPYLEGTKFSIRTDRNPLKWLLNIADASGRLARWRLRLAEFEFDVQYHPGRKHNLADGMSRLRSEGSDQSPLDDEIPVFTVSEAPLDEQTATHADNTDRHIIGYWDPDDDDETTGLPAVLAISREETDVVPITLEEFLTEQANDPFCKAIAEQVGTGKSAFDYDRYGLLVRKSPLDGALQRVVPKSIRPRLLYLSHYPRLAGHS